MLSDADSEFTAGYSMSNILKILLDPESSIIAVRINLKSGKIFVLEKRKR
jgi:hypothetical protein